MFFVKGRLPKNKHTHFCQAEPQGVHCCPIFTVFDEELVGFILEEIFPLAMAMAIWDGLSF